MTRQWLALIALLTGLAAVGAPVNAAAAEALSCEIGASAEVSSQAAAELAQAHRPLETVKKTAATAPEFDISWAAEIAPQTVLIGIDRAYE